MTSPDRVCRSVEEDLSALLDGELSPAAAAAALEHAFGCASCRTFFRAAKKLQGVADELAARPAASTRTAAASSGFGARSMRPFLRAAALVTIGLSGGWMLSNLPFPSAGGTPSAVPTAARAMTEERFVALAGELMAAEPKYQRTMLEVLRLVPALETGEGLGGPDDSGYVRASVEPSRARRGAV